MNHLARVLLLLLLLLVLLAGCSASDPSPRDRLSSRLARLEDPSTFTFRYTAAGTGVLDCVIAHREFTLTVDTERRAVDVVDRAGAPLAERTDRGLWLAAASFAGPVPGEWVPMDDVGADVANAVAGPDLARYLLADELPANGPRYVRGLLEDATRVAARGDDAWRLGFDDRPEDGIESLTVDVKLGRDGVEAIVASGTIGGEIPAGFTMTFVDEPVSVSLRNPIAPVGLRPEAMRPAPQSSCEL